MKENNSTPAITPIPKEIPFQREVEYHGHVIDVATEQLSKFFGLNRPRISFHSDFYLRRKRQHFF